MSQVQRWLDLENQVEHLQELLETAAASEAAAILQATVSAGEAAAAQERVRELEKSVQDLNTERERAQSLRIELDSAAQTIDALREAVASSATSSASVAGLAAEVRQEIRQLAEVKPVPVVFPELEPMDFDIIIQRGSDGIMQQLKVKEKQP